MLQKVFTRWGGKVFLSPHYRDAIRRIAEDSFDALGGGQLSATEVREFLNEAWRPNFLVWDVGEQDFVPADIPDEIWSEFCDDLVAELGRIVLRDAEWRKRTEG